MNASAHLATKPVAFDARVRRGTQGKHVLRVPAATFIERFLQHVLPSGFKRIRHYGLLAPAAKATKLPQARQALSVPAPDPMVTASVEAFMQRIGRGEWARCTHCQEGRFVPTAAMVPLRGAQCHIPTARAPP